MQKYIRRVWRYQRSN